MITKAGSWVRATATAVLLIAGVTTIAPAQDREATLTGHVTSQSTTRPLQGALVTVEGTELTARTDSVGRWTIRRVPAGAQTVLVRMIGQAAARLPVIVPTTGSVNVDVALAENSLRLNQIIVTADPAGRAKGELGTATVIDRDAIANQITSSLQGILELLPGVVLQLPGLDAATQFSLGVCGAGSL